MSIIVIDPDTKIIGCYILGNGCATVDLSKDKHKLGSLVNSISNLVMTYEPSVIFIEDYAFSRNGKGARHLAECVGLIKYVGELYKVPIIKVNISMWKKYVDYKNSGLPKKDTKKNKDKYTSIVNKVFGSYISNHNEADAYMIMSAVVNIFRDYTNKIELSEGASNFMKVVNKYPKVVKILEEVVCQA